MNYVSSAVCQQHLTAAKRRNLSPRTHADGNKTNGPNAVRVFKYKLEVWAVWKKRTALNGLAGLHNHTDIPTTRSPVTNSVAPSYDVT